MQVMSLGCLHSRFVLFHGLIHMIGPNARLFIQERVQGGTLKKSIIAVSHVLILRKDSVDLVIFVNLLMGFLNAGCTLHNTEPGYVKMEPFVLEGSVFLPTNHKNCASSVFQLGLLWYHHIVRQLAPPPCHHHLCCTCTATIFREATRDCRLMLEKFTFMILKCIDATRQQCFRHHTDRWCYLQ